MLIKADARSLPLVDGCVDCCVTSPPYFGLRDYGNAGQIGLESTPDAYVAQLVAVFREVRRVLKDDGTVWLNLGDSYTTGASTSARSSDPKAVGDVSSGIARIGTPQGLKPKDLIGIPWRVAFALQADGWYLRSDIIWHKPNPMPESVTDRPTKAHEYLFLLAKSERYYFDAEAVKEKSSGSRGGRFGAGGVEVGRLRKDAARPRPDDTGFRNKRSVWTVPTMPYSGAHFATMPEKLVEPCILAGCPLGGRVLDPFIGSGTVGAVAERLGRRWVGTDLSYQDLSRKRTAQKGLMFGELREGAHV